MEKRTVHTVLITGCSDGGLGAALAVAFHKTGIYRVIATARSLPKMTQLQSLGIGTLELDVLSEESISACVEKVSTMTDGTLDVLVNNAGAGYESPVLDVSIEEVRKQFELNVFSAIRIIQSFFPLLRKSKAKRTMIVNNTSAAPVLTLPFYGPYTASKSALSAFTETLRLEMQPFDIAVVDLRTAGVKTRFFDNVSANPATTIPESSVYTPGKDLVEKYIREGIDQVNMDADVWARKVVGDLLRKKEWGARPKQIWRGKGGTGAWFAATFLPKSWLDGTVRKLTELGEIESRIRAAEEEKDTGRGRVGERAVQQ